MAGTSSIVSGAAANTAAAVRRNGRTNRTWRTSEPGKGIAEEEPQPASDHDSDSTLPKLPSSRAPSRVEDSDEAPRTTSMPTPSTFEKVKTKSGEVLVRYNPKYNQQWLQWLSELPEWQRWCGKYKKTAIKWDNPSRNSIGWDSVWQGATLSGEPKVVCVFCETVMQHPSASGTKGLLKHNSSSVCRASKARKADKGPDVLQQLLQTGTKRLTRRQRISYDIPEWTSQADWDTIFMKALVSIDVSPRAVENVHLRATYQMLNKDHRFPSETHLRRLMAKYYEEVQAAIKEELPRDRKISLAVDAWTSSNKLAFLAVMGYFIDDNWELQELLLGFEHLPAEHTGKELAKAVFGVLTAYDICGNLGAITSDNASNNDTMCKELALLLAIDGYTWDGEANRIGCLAHTIQLITGKFVESIGATAKDEVIPKAFKCKQELRQLQKAGTGFPRTIAKVLPVKVIGGASEGTGSSLTSGYFQVRALAVAIGSSPQRNAVFMSLQEGKVDIVRGMVRDVATRWNSTLAMLDRAYALRPFIEHWVTQVAAHHIYKELLLTDDEWGMVQYALTVLKPLRQWTLWVSTTRYITVHKTYAIYNEIINHFNDVIETLEKKRIRWKVQIREAATAARDYASAVWSNLDSVNLADGVQYPGSNKSMPRRSDYWLAMSTVVDPYTKLEEFKLWDQIGDDTEYEDTYHQRFMEWWEAEYAPAEDLPSSEKLSPAQRRREDRLRRNRRHGGGSQPSTPAPPQIRRSLSGTLLEVLETPLAPPPSPRARARRHVDLYLSDPCAQATVPAKSLETPRWLKDPDPIWEEIHELFCEQDSVLAWWKTHSRDERFKDLSLAARDFLAAPAAAVGCERLFVSSRDRMGYRKSRTTARTLAQTMLVKEFDKREMREMVRQSDSSGQSERERLELERAAAKLDFARNLAATECTHGDEGVEGGISDAEEDEEDAHRDVDHDGSRYFARRKDCPPRLPAPNPRIRRRGQFFALGMDDIDNSADAVLATLKDCQDMVHLGSEGDGEDDVDDALDCQEEGSEAAQDSGDSESDIEEDDFELQSVPDAADEHAHLLVDEIDTGLWGMSAASRKRSRHQIPSARDAEQPSGNSQLEPDEEARLSEECKRRRTGTRTPNSPAETELSLHLRPPSDIDMQPAQWGIHREPILRSSIASSSARSSSIPSITIFYSSPPPEASPFPPDSASDGSPSSQGNLNVVGNLLSSPTPGSLDKGKARVMPARVTPPPQAASGQRKKSKAHPAPKFFEPRPSPLRTRSGDAFAAGPSGGTRRQKRS